MTGNEHELWCDMVDRMIERLHALDLAMEGGASCRDPRVAVETSEIRALDLLGVRLMAQFVPEATVRSLWHIHEDAECSSILSSIRRLRANRHTFRVVVRSYVTLRAER